MIKNVEKKKKLAYYSFWMYNYASVFIIRKYTLVMLYNFIEKVYDNRVL